MFNFADIPCNKTRGATIVEFCELVRTGDRSAHEVELLRIQLVTEALDALKISEALEELLYG